MKLYPYGQIKTQNLGLLLLTARVLALLGMLFTVLLVFYGVVGSPIAGTYYGVNTYLLMFKGVLLSLGLIAASGLLAAVVSLEYEKTKN
jgi:hypothetical protein